MTKDIERKVSAYIQKNTLFAPTDRVLVALSGGADSVALLRILLALDYECEAAHCNFHLRGEESNRDERFAEKLCKHLQIPLHIAHFDTVTSASTRHISIEMAARELRYQWFEEKRIATKSTTIAIAHHKDDSIETFLLNLLRGTGLNGLCGIRPLNGHIVRPLLCLTHEEILAYLNKIGQDFVTDSTNLENCYLRNKIRLDILPLLETINPQARLHILQAAERIDKAIPYVRQAMETARSHVMSADGLSINTHALLSEHDPETLLFYILQPLGFNAAQTKSLMETLLNGQSGKTIKSNQWRAIIDRKHILLSPLDSEKKTPPHISTEDISSEGFQLIRDKNTACIDADKIRFPLQMRHWESGDWFIPLGMKGRKLLSDYMTDRKFSLLQKEKQWVLTSGKDIVWVIGQCIDNRYRITPHTKQIRVIRLLE